LKEFTSKEDVFILREREMEKETLSPTVTGAEEAEAGTTARG
jgi:hypothetical protein